MLSRSRGFTLVEVMVTMAVIGMLALTVSFVVPDRRDDTVEETSRMLYERIKYAREYAMVRNAVLGLRIENDDPSYRFVQFTDGRWQNIDHRGLRNTELDSDITLNIEAADLELLQQDGTELDSVFGVDDDDDNVREDSSSERVSTPQLFIFGSGDLPPFELQVRDNYTLSGVTWHIRSKDGIEVSLQRGDR